MALHELRSQRLFVDQDLAPGVTIEADREKANYLLNVLRMGNGSPVLLFNGRDGEWQAMVMVEGRKKCRLVVETQTRPQPSPYPLTYCFAPLKQARLDYMVQKAVEMGCGRLQPVLTQYTQVRQLNEKRLRANAIEAAEQCGILNLPEIAAPVALSELISCLETGQELIICDEAAPQNNPLEGLKARGQTRPAGIAILIGPEGGFSPEERTWLRTLDTATLLGLGPRILRADTAAVAALAIVQATIGDWYRGEQP